MSHDSDHAPSRGTARSVLFLVTEDWYFWAHRRALARAARDAGYRVIVATRTGKLARDIEAEGFELHPLSWRRGSANPFGLVRDVAQIVRLYRRVRPDVVHHVSLKPVVLGSIGRLLVRPLPTVNALTGLGYVFTSASVRARLFARILTPLLRFLLRRPGTMTLVENRDDRQFLIEATGIANAQIAVMRGSGIDLQHFSPMPLPDHGPITIGCAARMLESKGIADLVEAGRILRLRGILHRIIVAGPIDAENPEAIREETLRSWVAGGDIEWLGQIRDVRELWCTAHIAALASRTREGLPLSLVEAAACGRPLVATDIPGSREIAQAGINALLVPPKNPAALADALERLATDAALRHAFAAASRKIVERGFSTVDINAATLALYERLLADQPAARRSGRALRPTK